MALPKSTRVKCVADKCLLTRTWSDQKPLVLYEGDTVDVPPAVAAYLDSLTNWAKTTKRAKKPKPEHTEKKPPSPPKE